jgi:hypothetical protein
MRRRPETGHSFHEIAQAFGKGHVPIQFMLSEHGGLVPAACRNFRDLNAAVVRMATLAQGGRISVEIVEEEIDQSIERTRRNQKPAPRIPYSRSRSPCIALLIHLLIFDQR